jgi:hypothetical protein
MTMRSVPNLALINGVGVPRLGFGVFRVRPEETVEAATTALGPATATSTRRRRSGGANGRSRRSDRANATHRR